MTASVRVVFFGTPDFAVPSLGALVHGGFDVPLVVTQPDRPVGRHAELRPSAVARVRGRARHPGREAGDGYGATRRCSRRSRRRGPTRSPSWPTGGSCRSRSCVCRGSAA